MERRQQRFIRLVSGKADNSKDCVDLYSVDFKRTRANVIETYNSLKGPDVLGTGCVSLILESRTMA